jgi:hypothetical protein
VAAVVTGVIGFQCAFARGLFADNRDPGAAYRSPGGFNALSRAAYLLTRRSANRGTSRTEFQCAFARGLFADSPFKVCRNLPTEPKV